MVTILPFRSFSFDQVDQRREGGRLARARWVRSRWSIPRPGLGDLLQAKGAASSLVQAWGWPPAPERNDQPRTARAGRTGRSGTAPGPPGRLGGPRRGPRPRPGPRRWPGAARVRSTGCLRRAAPSIAGPPHVRGPSPPSLSCGDVPAWRWTSEARSDRRRT